MAYTAVLVACLAFLLTVSGQVVNPYQLTGFYQPLTAAAYLSAVPQTGTATTTQTQMTNTGAAAAQTVSQPPTDVVNVLRPDGTYGFGYQTVDGQGRTETTLPDGSTQGSYTYRTPDGQTYTVGYTAGRHGFSITPVAASGTTSGTGTYVATTGTTAIVADPTATAAQTVPAIQHVAYNAVPQQAIYPSYYPWGSWVSPEQHSAAATLTTGQPIASQYTAAASAAATGGVTTTADQAAAATVPFPYGFAYGTNPYAVQQMQQLLG